LAAEMQRNLTYRFLLCLSQYRFIDFCICINKEMDHCWDNCHKNTQASLQIYNLWYLHICKTYGTPKPVISEVPTLNATVLFTTIDLIPTSSSLRLVLLHKSAVVKFQYAISSQ
jgi:hypothetical protein